MTSQQINILKVVVVGFHYYGLVVPLLGLVVHIEIAGHPTKVVWALNLQVFSALLKYFCAGLKIHPKVFPALST